MMIDPNLMLAALKGHPEVRKPGDTGDDSVLPPDPGNYPQPGTPQLMPVHQPVTEYGAQPTDEMMRRYGNDVSKWPYQNFQQNPMPFPNNHNPDTDFNNRWPAQLPPSGILNDLKPNLDPGPQMVRKLPSG